MTYRRKCEHCGDIFFSPARDAAACPKCVRRYGLKPPRPTPSARPPQGRPADTAPRPPEVRPAPPAAPRPPTPVATRAPDSAPPVSAPRAGAPAIERQQRPPRPERPAHPAPAKPPREPPPPRARELTEERRAAILAACREHPPAEGEPARVLHARIASQLHVTRQMVANVLAGQTMQELTDDVRRAVGERYRQYVERMERPPDSRHRALAQEFGLTRQQTDEALLAILQALPNPRDHDPSVLFRIEQAYWRHLQARDVPLMEIPAAVAAEQSLHPWVVARYLDMIHDDPTRLARTPLPDEATQRRILDGYARYLAGDAPYQQGLHATLAAETGATIRQVHRVLLDHRWAARRTAAG